MPYRYLDDIATADIAFEATGQTQEDMFAAAADAIVNVIILELDLIEDKAHECVECKADSLEMLLFSFLQELIFIKDTRKLLFRVKNVSIEKKDEEFLLRAECRGEELDPPKHKFQVDVKAVTLYKFGVEETPNGFRARVVVDI